MTFNTRSLLLGSAIVALSYGVTNTAQAQTNLAGDSTYGTTAPVNAPTANIDIDLQGFNLIVDNTDNTAIGAVTDTGGTPDGNITVQSSAAADMTQTIGSIDNGTGNFVLQNTTNDADIAVTITNGFDIGGTLTINGDADGTDQSADDLTLTIGGASVVTGITAIDSGDVAGAFTTLNLDGATNTFTGAVTVTGGDGDAANDSSIVLSGAAANFAGDLTLTDGAAGQAILTLDGGTTAQNVTGNIAGNGDINVVNSAGVTFAGTVTSGTVLIEQTAADAAATFQNTVNSAITLGAAGTGANTVTFDTTTQAFTVTGAVAGAIAGETNAIVVSGDDILTQATDWTANIDTITVGGTATLNSDAALTATTITIGSGTTLDQGVGNINAAVVNNGTLQITGAGTVTGNVTGTGTLDVDLGNTVTGSITQGAADIAAVTLNAAGANDYNVGTTTFSGNGTVAFDAGARTITGNFTNASDGEGTITIADNAGTTAIVGNLGASTANSLAALTVTGGAANLVTTTGNLYVDAITLNDADTLQFVGGSQTVSGTITDGIITVGDGATATNVMFNNTLASIAGATVSANASATYGANAAFTAAYTNTGTTTVNQGATLTIAGADFSDSGNYVFQVSDANGTIEATDYGSLTDADGGATLTPSNLSINVAGTPGEGTVQFLTGINTGAATLADNSAQYTFTVANNAGNTDITSSRSTLTSLVSASGSNVQNAAVVLDTLSGSTDPQITAINSSLATASTSAEVAEVIEAVTPTVDAGAAVAANAVVNQTTGLTNTQLASLRDGTETGMVAGNISNGLRAWGQFFGTSGEQDNRDGVDGFDVDTYGLAVGIDTENLGDNWIWGLVFAYADTDVDSRNANTTQSEIESYQIGMYANYDIDDRTYMSGQLGYVMGNIDQTRNNVGGVSGLTASADYDSDTIVARFETGRRYAAGGNTILTPKLMMNYQNFDAEGYTETGAGGANLQVDGESLNMLELGVAMDAHWDHQQADGSYIQPKLTAGVRHDLIGDQYETTSRFTAGGANFKTEGFDPAQTTFNAGAGVTYFSTSNWELNAKYDFEFKEDYDAHSGTLNAAYKW